MYRFSWIDIPPSITSEIRNNIGKRNLSFFGLPGCGKTTALEAIWNHIPKLKIQGIFVSPVELIRFANGLSNKIFCQCKNENTEFALFSLSTLKKEVSKRKSIIFIPSMERYLLL